MKDTCIGQKWPGRRDASSKSIFGLFQYVILFTQDSVNRWHHMITKIVKGVKPIFFYPQPHTRKKVYVLYIYIYIYSEREEEPDSPWIMSSESLLSS